MDLSLYEELNGFAFRHGGFEDVLRFFALDAQWGLTPEATARSKRDRRGRTQAV
jgi:hypothetical protein